MIKSMRVILISFILISIVLTFNNKYSDLVKSFEYTVQSKEATLNRQIDTISGYVEIISVFGNDYFQREQVIDSIYFRLLRYNSELNNYNLDLAGESNLRKTEGNITGIGTIPESDIARDQLNLAFQFNKIFNRVYNKLPDVLSLYYTSEQNFVNRYPWIHSENFSFSEGLKTKAFYTFVMPKNNVTRKSLWIPARVNHDDLGLIITNSTPIYNKDIFMGVVSIDFTNKHLNKLIESEYEGFLVDQTNTIIATSKVKADNNKVIKLNEYLEKVKGSVYIDYNFKLSSVEKMIGSYYYTIELPNAPWKLYYQVPIGTIVIKSFISTLPILFISIFLLLTIHEVEKRIKTEVLLKESIDKLKSYQELLESAAKMDFLTATYNRRGLYEKFNQITNQNYDNRPISILIGDIDYFKQYNDNYGHAIGDKVLMEIAELLKNNITENDIVCRWGGEEFLILLINQNYEEAMVIGEKIRSKIESNIIKCENLEFRVTITIGISEYDESNSLKDSVLKADQALYMGKNQGRNMVIGYRDISNN